jgi:hypothetical protein
MEFLKWLFYACMIIPIICELEAILSTNKLIAIGKRVKDIGKLSHDEKLVAFQADKELSSAVIIYSFYLTWLFFGLFSSLNWSIFLFLLLVSFIPKRIFLLRFADGIISFCLLIFAFINAFHLHINMFNVIKGVLV